VARDPGQLVGEVGWTTVSELLTEVSRSTLRTWVAAGKLVRLRPGVLALPGAAENWRIRVAAAVHEREAVASNVTALALWELMPHPPGPVHVTVDPRMSGRGSAGVVVHRAADAYAERRRVGGLPVSSAERALVDAWGHRPRGSRRPSERRRSAASAADSARLESCGTS
jgi:predicted transcriptional regulator of viral defense system